jgi:hypothetical protein
LIASRFERFVTRQPDDRLIETVDEVRRGQEHAIGSVGFVVRQLLELGDVRTRVGGGNRGFSRKVRRRCLKI